VEEKDEVDTRGVEVGVAVVMVDMIEDTIKIVTLEIEVIINGNMIRVDTVILTVQNVDILILELQIQRGVVMMNIPEL